MKIDQPEPRVYTDLLELRDDALTRANYRCEFPGCREPGPLEMAHLRHRGMGGSKTANTLENVAILCRWHHAVFDGRDTYNRREEVRRLLAATDRLDSDADLLEPLVPGWRWRVAQILAEYLGREYAA